MNIKQARIYTIGKVAIGEKVGRVGLEQVIYDFVSSKYVYTIYIGRSKWWFQVMKFDPVTKVPGKLRVRLIHEESMSLYQMAEIFRRLKKDCECEL